ncbi:MAG: hypothetical protein V1644_03930 [Candidatus Micrarchaeota archaeon]
MGIVLRIKATDKVTLSERAIHFLQSLSPVREIPISEAEWNKLSPYMQEKVKKDQIHWITTT